MSFHNTADGKLSFAPVDVPARQLHKRLETLHENQEPLEAETTSNGAGPAATLGNKTASHEDTDDYAQRGGFLNMQRGGRSTENSFRRRPLSPPFITDSSEMLPESSLQASTPKQFPTISTNRNVSATGRTTPGSPPGSPPSPVMPRAPHPSPEKRPQLPQSHSGSPLKLFGPYDTYTNQTLLRRISQFEDQAGDEASRVPKQEGSSKSEKSMHFGSDDKMFDATQEDHSRFGTLNRFGEGELDGYEFVDGFSFNTLDRSRSEDKENRVPSATRPMPSHMIFDIHQDSPEGPSAVMQRRRGKMDSSASSKKYGSLSRPFASSRPQSASQVDRLKSVVFGTPKRDLSDGKRPRTSPSKDPTPKRRRTLHRSDIAYGLEHQLEPFDPAHSSQHDVQYATETESDEAQEEEFQQAASLANLAIRPSLRPRSPSPTPRSSERRERKPLTEIGYGSHEHEDEQPVQPQMPDIIVQDFAADGSRKTSMKTQDYFDAAEEIMAMIRSKARPSTGLSSVAESEENAAELGSHGQLPAFENSDQESSIEPFSRPPSREGGWIQRLPLRQQDPELADRLKKYEESSDLGDIITHSLQSLRRIKDATHDPNSVTETIHQSGRRREPLSGTRKEQRVISDIPNVRLSRNPDRPSSSSAPIEFFSSASLSSASSTGRSIPTCSSQGSESRRLIAPDVVTQLIGDQVGNMVFDKKHKKWRRVKTPLPSARPPNFLLAEDSDDDPFASIPDLSVDTLKESQNLHRVSRATHADPDEDIRDGSRPSSWVRRSPHGGQESAGVDDSRNDINLVSLKVRCDLRETAVEDDAEIEHEITIHEDRLQRSSPGRRRNLTISFSSPIASFIQDVAHQDSDEGPGLDINFSHRSATNPVFDLMKRDRHVKCSKAVGSTRSGSQSRSRSRAVSGNEPRESQPFVPRPVSRIDEHDEEAGEERLEADDQRQLSLRGDSSLAELEHDDKPNKSLSFILKTPAAAQPPVSSATPIISHHVGTFSLSPLSEFTVHQADQSCALEVSYVVDDRYLITGNGTKKIMSQAVRSLVEKITEVEPFEPDWESMRELDVSNKRLETLHMLEEFCTDLVTLDASNNIIGHLEGVPQSVRNLRLTNNFLSELTAWGHLVNLQYIDISDNGITSLLPFTDLVHLRTLRADNNQITSLDGIKFHDSLQVLRVRGNLIEDVNFEGTGLGRLTELDLENNQISSIRYIEQLPCLTTLNLQRNRLEFFSVSGGQSMPWLKYLKLSDNELLSLDLSLTPSLRLLHVDRNALTRVTGFSRCRRLDSLSLREQQSGTPLDVSFLDAAYEVRKLFLSGNVLLEGFAPRVDLLNLQYLELANCGLQTLPPRLGQLTPNLRVLNLGFNALADLAPLRYIPRLKKLLVPGNRLADAARLARTLADFPHLARLDVRDNPATLGFYPPLQTLVRAEQLLLEAGDHDPFVLPDVDPDRDARFAARLDMGTRMRRRLYEMVVLERCVRLKTLDGLRVAREDVQRRDVVWRALVEKGVLDGAAADDGAESPC
ncbi:WD repeat domain-containing protein [Xylariomycetidae sp. FL0641]|nr:WD repeat domain-containing protein [Xylariomycetidae sp. FL0641]